MVLIMDIAFVLSNKKDPSCKPSWPFLSFVILVCS